jgi:hypothetical protein
MNWNRILFGISTAIKSLNNAHTKVLLLFNIHATNTSVTEHVTARLKQNLKTGRALRIPYKF